MKQQRLELPPAVSTPSPLFTNVSQDYAGPFKVRGEFRTQITSKVLILLYGCLATEAICLLAVRGYNTDSFLL